MIFLHGGDGAEFTTCAKACFGWGEALLLEGFCK